MRLRLFAALVAALAAVSTASFTPSALAQTNDGKEDTRDGRGGSGCDHAPKEDTVS